MNDIIQLIKIEFAVTIDGNWWKFINVIDSPHTIEEEKEGEK